MKERVTLPQPLMSDHPEMAFLDHSLAADIQSMLSVPDPILSLLWQPQKKPVTSKRPQGTSRELYELIQELAPLVIPQQLKPHLKLKHNLVIMQEIILGEAH